MRVNAVDEISQNFIDSSYDVNTNRAFPDARDGLKPGQRACLWEMYKNGYVSSKPHVKSAKISGMVCANLWPHGDSAIYDTFVRMSQPWININPEVDFHGANGNQILGPDPAASRYTEARLSPIAEKGMLDGVEKNAVDMMLNFSEDAEWPTVLPSVFPRLLVNGAKGIGVSIANTWLPHSLPETYKVISHYIATGEVRYDYYPDFPSGGTIINSKSELEEINKTGKGRVVLEAKYSIDQKNREINFTEFCYQTYIEPIIEQIKEAYDGGKLQGMKSVLNKSDKTRLLLCVKYDRSCDPNELLAQLFECSDLRCQYNANCMAIVGKTPKMLTLGDMLDIYVKHNVECIRREYEYDLNKTLARIEILEGLETAIANIDEVVSIIRNSKDAGAAKSALKDKYELSDAQTDAILSMRLSRLTNLDGIEIGNELNRKRSDGMKYKDIVEHQYRQTEELLERLKAITEAYGYPRFTKIEQKVIVKTNQSKSKENEQDFESFIWLDEDGYLYRELKTKAGCIKCKSKNDTLLLFSTLGKAYRIKCDDVELNGKVACGSIITTNGSESIIAIKNRGNIGFITRNGKTKIMCIEELLSSTRNLKGTCVMPLDDGDVIVGVYEEKSGNRCSVSVDGKEMILEIKPQELSSKVSKGTKAFSTNKKNIIVKEII